VCDSTSNSWVEIDGEKKKQFPNTLIPNAESARARFADLCGYAREVGMAHFQLWVASCSASLGRVHAIRGPHGVGCKVSGNPQVWFGIDRQM